MDLNLIESTTITIISAIPLQLSHGIKITNLLKILPPLFTLLKGKISNTTVVSNVGIIYAITCTLYNNSNYFPVSTKNLFENFKNLNILNNLFGKHKVDYHFGDDSMLNLNHLKI